MSRKTENIGFVCVNCGYEVVKATNGSYRNHCPNCLFSLHVDNKPGDRSSNCLGLMKPIGIQYHSNKGYQLEHKCMKCGTKKVNKIAENTEMPDNFELIFQFMRNWF